MRVGVSRKDFSLVPRRGVGVQGNVGIRNEQRGAFPGRTHAYACFTRTLALHALTIMSRGKKITKIYDNVEPALIVPDHFFCNVRELLLYQILIVHGVYILYTGTCGGESDPCTPWSDTCTTTSSVTSFVSGSTWLVS